MMDYNSAINAIGDVQYLMSYLPDTIVVESVKLDNNGIEIILKDGIEDFADLNELELAEEFLPPEMFAPVCRVRLAVSPELKTRVWQFDELKEAPRK